MKKHLLFLFFSLCCMGLHAQNSDNGLGTYEGDYVNGKKDGEGTFVWPDGSVYQGEWKNDMRHGEGTYTWPDGDSYTGEWENNRINGYGTFKSASGFEYTGQWMDDKHHGFGTYVLPNGSTFTGEFKEGIKHGVGVMKYADGTVIKGIWQEGFYMPCDCDPFLSPSQAYDISSAVFIGEVLDIEEMQVSDNVYLTVKKEYKGELKDVVLMEIEYTSCYVPFEVGESYVVYAFQFEDGVLSTDFCARTKNVEQATLDLDFLNSK